MISLNSRPRKPLRGLKAAAQVAKSLEGRQTLDLDEKIIEQFNGDKQLAMMWRSFVIHNKWVIINSHGRYVITEKGNRWTSRILQLIVLTFHAPVAAYLPIHLEPIATSLFYRTLDQLHYNIFSQSI
jgi:hypothetical protein